MAVWRHYTHDKCDCVADCASSKTQKLRSPTRCASWEDSTRVRRCVVGAMVALGAAAATAVQAQPHCPRCEGLPPDIQARLQQFCLVQPNNDVCKPMINLDVNDTPETVIPIPREYFEREQPPVHIAPFQVKISACPGCVGQDFASQLFTLHICVRYRHGVPKYADFVRDFMRGGCGP
jgi:hypothetical protein